MRKIGFDLDEVLVEQLRTLVQFYHQRTGIHIPYERFHSYRWHEVWDVPYTEAVELDYAFKESEAFANQPPVDGAVEGISKLVAMDYAATYITARPAVFRERTQLWLDRHLGHVRATLIHSSEKYNVCHAEGITELVEDDGKHAIPCADNGITVLMPDRPWNRDVCHKNIIRVYSWSEIVDYFEKSRSDHW